MRSSPPCLRSDTIPTWRVPPPPGCAAVLRRRLWPTSPGGSVFPARKVSPPGTIDEGGSFVELSGSRTVEKGVGAGHPNCTSSVPNMVVDDRPNGLHGLAIICQAILPWRALFSQSPRFASVQPPGDQDFRASAEDFKAKVRITFRLWFRPRSAGTLDFSEDRVYN